MRPIRTPTLFLLLVIPLQAAPVRFDIVRDQSTVAVRTDKAGLGAFFGAGHRHAIIAEQFTARVCADPQTLGDATVSVAIPTASLRIDTPEAKRAAGLTESGPSAKDVATIQQKMLSSANLAASEHPEIRFEGSGGPRQGDTLNLRGSLTVRGRQAAVSVPLRATQSGNSYRLRGSFEVKQTDFGITPESVAGIVRVADKVTVMLDIAVQPTGEACR